MKTIVIVGLLAATVIGVAVWFRRKPAKVLGNGTGTIPTQVSPPTTGGGIVDQVVNNANGILDGLSRAKDLFSGWGGNSDWSSGDSNGGAGTTYR